MTMSNESSASAVSHPPLVSPLRRLSICRQLSDALKSRRKSFSSSSTSTDLLLPSPSPSATINSASSTFTFVWNCALTEVDSPPGSSSNEDLPHPYPTRRRKNALSDDPHGINVKEITGSMVAACLIKQKSVSCDDMAFLSSSTDEQTIGASGTALIGSATASFPSKTTGFCHSFFFSLRQDEEEEENNNTRTDRIDCFVYLEKDYAFVSSTSRMNNRILAKTSAAAAAKERNEKRNSTGSALLISVSEKEEEIRRDRGLFESGNDKRHLFVIALIKRDDEDEESEKHLGLRVFFFFFSLRSA